MLQYEFEKVHYQLEKGNNTDALLTVGLPFFFRKEKVAVKVRYHEVHSNFGAVVAYEITLPSVPMNPLLIRAINEKAKRFQKIASGEGGPYESLRAHFEKRKLQEKVAKFG